MRRPLRAAALSALLAVSGCASGIEQIRVNYRLAEEPPPRPNPPKVVDGQPELPSMVQQARTVQAGQLPDFRRKTIGFGVEGADGELRLKLALSFLRAGATRFLDLAPLHGIKATASSSRTKSLTLQGTLDALARLGLYDRVDYVLSIPAVHCGARALAVRTPRHLDEEDVQRFEKAAAGYLAQANVYVAAVDRALEELASSYKNEVERYGREWNGRGFWQKMGDFFRGTKDDREEAEQRMRQARAHLVSRKAVAQERLPAPDEVKRRADVSPRSASLQVFRCSLGAMLVDASGPTLWAHQVAREAPRSETALDTAIDALVAALLQKSGLKPARVQSTSTAVPVRAAP